MIDFFHKGAEMTKKVTGVAKLKGAPKVNPRPSRKISRIGTFYDGEDAVASVLLEVADTPSARAQGLMGRESLPSICGMLFEGLTGPGYFWMKNCLVPIDVAFMDKDGTITKTYSMPVDKDGEEHYEYGADDKTAVEVSMGFLKSKGIGTGFRFEARDLSDKGDTNG